MQAWLGVLLLFFVLSAVAVGAVLFVAIQSFVMLLAAGAVVATGVFSEALLPTLCAVMTCQDPHSGA